MSTKSPIDRPTGQPVTGESVMKWRRRLDEESRKERHAILVCFGVGLSLNCVVLAAGLLLGEIAARMGPQPRATTYLVGLCVAAGICAIMLIVAAFTKPEGRAETARQIFDRGTDYAMNEDYPGEALAFSVANIIALYGGFAIVEASKRTQMRVKLAKVDRNETARILAEICNVPAGIPWKNLLQPYQSVQSLRGPIALLILDGWIQIVDRGQTVAQRTPAMRRLMHRHPLAEVFT